MNPTTQQFFFSIRNVRTQTTNKQRENCIPERDIAHNHTDLTHFWTLFPPKHLDLQSAFKVLVLCCLEQKRERERRRRGRRFWRMRRWKQCLRSLLGDYTEVSAESYSSLRLSTREPRNVAEGTHSFYSIGGLRSCCSDCRPGVGGVDDGM